MTGRYIPLVVAAASILLFAIPASVAGSDRPGIFEAVEAAYQAGQIDRNQMLVEEMNIFFTPPPLATSTKADQSEVLKSGTGLIQDVLDHYDEFSPEQQLALAQYLSRPGTQAAYDSPAGFFKIHYDTTGPEAVPAQDDDLDGIPDYVERTAQYADSSWLSYVVHLGYYPPPSDHGGGGDDRYDIYLLAISGYGATLPESAGDSTWSDYSSFMLIHRNFYGFLPNYDPAGDSIGAQKVTCAHELFHAVELAYDRYESLWWMEACATRMEDIVFPEVDDNYNYLPYFFYEPETNLQSTEGYHMYGAFVWPLFLDLKFGSPVIRGIWEYCRFRQDLEAIDSGLAVYGATTVGVFPEFAYWNYFTGYRAVPGEYFPDASMYPAADVDLTFTTLVQDSVTPVNKPEGLACNYIEFAVDTSARGILSLHLKGAEFVSWAMTGIIRDGGDGTLITKNSFLGNPIDIYLPFIEDYTRVTAVPTVVSPNVSGGDYVLSCTLYGYGDCNQDRKVNVGDATYIIGYIFRGGPVPIPVLPSGDANCDGKINVADAVYIVTYIFRGGPKPCAARN
ncbi:MAG: dockerin type I repeat-containing protein [candidate division Zixibacteria bacterium]|nr:dockerin type I repeat-containing protein [candidate division Zixibacteria bacterium]